MKIIGTIIFTGVALFWVHRLGALQFLFILYFVFTAVRSSVEQTVSTLEMKRGLSWILELIELLIRLGGLFFGIKVADFVQEKLFYALPNTDIGIIYDDIGIMSLFCLIFPWAIMVMISLWALNKKTTWILAYRLKAKAVKEEERVQRLREATAIYSEDLLRVCDEIGFSKTAYQERPEEHIDSKKQYRILSDLSLEAHEPVVFWVDNDERLVCYEKFSKMLYQHFEAKGYLGLPAYESLESESAAYPFNVLCESIERYLETFEESCPDGISDKAATRLQEIHHLTDWCRAFIKTRRSEFLSDYRGVRIGVQGEQSVNEELEPHINIINLPNVRVEVEGESVENDNILLTRNGIFTLEVKNFGTSGAFDLIIEADGRWLRRYQDGKTEVMKSVTAQNNRHIGYLNRLINQKLGTTIDTFIDVEGIIVIANERVGIENHNPRQIVIRKADIYNHVMAHPVRYSAEQLKEIEILLESETLKPKPYPLHDFEKEFLNVLDPILSLCHRVEKECKQNFINQTTSVIAEIAIAHQKINQ